MADHTGKKTTRYEIREIDWSSAYSAIGEFVVEFEKIPKELRFFYNVILQQNGLKNWKLGSFLLHIETIGPIHLSLAVRAAIFTLHPDCKELIEKADLVHKKTVELTKLRNEIAHGEWGIGPEVIYFTDSPKVPEQIGYKRKISKNGEIRRDLPTVAELHEASKNVRELVRAINDIKVATVLKNAGKRE